MTTNPLKGIGKENSPTEPNECCVWANARLHPAAAELGLRWVVTPNGKHPIALER